MSILASIQCPSREDRIVDGELVQDFATTLQYMSPKRQHVKTISDGFKVDKTEIKTEQKVYDGSDDNEKLKLDTETANIVSFIKTFSFFNDQFNLFMESIRIAAKFNLRIPDNMMNTNVVDVRSQCEIIHEIILHTLDLNDEFTMDPDTVTKLDSLYWDIINNYDDGVELINSFINLIC